MFKTPEEIKQEQSDNAAEIKKVTEKIEKTRMAATDPEAYRKMLLDEKNSSEAEYIAKRQATEDLKKQYKEEQDMGKKAILEKRVKQAEDEEVNANKKMREADSAALELKHGNTAQMKARNEEKLFALEKQKLELEEKKKSLENRSATISAAPTTTPTSGSTSSGMSSYLQKVAQVESGGKADAKAKTSTASGLFQFTEGTWKETTKAMGKNYSLEDRFDPKKSAEVAKFFTEQQKSQLEKGTGKQASDADLYMAHFLGAGGATKFLNAMSKNPNAMATEGADPKQIEANKSIFLGIG
jgi:muramidase (phage lysozyme)